MQRHCLNCKEPIPDHIRSDAIYCSTSCGNTMRSRKWAKNNPKLILAKRKLENSRVETRIYMRVKSRAKIKGIPFNLDVSDIVIPELCPVLGIRIKTAPNKGRNPIHSASVDRIDPAKGYTKGNVRVISNRANLLKSNATIEEMEAVLDDLRKIQNR